MNKGVTLIELILFIVVIGIALPPLLILSSQAVYNSLVEEIRFTSVSLANEVIEGIKGKSFKNIVSEGPIYFSENFSKYSYTITVSYVNPDLTETAIPTNYKRITVTISNDIIPEIKTSITTIITNLL